MKPFTFVSAKRRLPGSQINGVPCTITVRASQLTRKHKGFYFFYSSTFEHVAIIIMYTPFPHAFIVVFTHDYLTLGLMHDLEVCLQLRRGVLSL